MNIYLKVVLVTFLSIVSCRDFYVGMFKKNDLLVAQDRLFKEKVPYKYMYAKYGRIFQCKITYFRVSDRLGYGPGPKVQIVRGGLNRKYLVLKLISPYNMPISVNIYVGCANTFTITKPEPRASITESEITEVTIDESNKLDSETTNTDNTHTTNEGAETTAAPTTAK